MADPDIVLEDEKTTVIGPMEFVDDGSAEPSVALDPDWRGLELGRGSGQGRVRVYPGGDDGGPQPAISIQGGGPDVSQRIQFYRDGTQSSLSITPNGIDLVGGYVMRASEIATDDLIASGELRASDFLQVGSGSDGEGGTTYTPGEIDVKGATGVDGDADTAVRIDGAPADARGPALTMKDETGLTSVELRGGRGAVKLGGSYEGHEVPTGTIQRPGVNGRVLLDDGAGTVVDVTADDGTISIGTTESGPVFEIDTDAEEIRTKYDIEEGAL